MSLLATHSGADGPPDMLGRVKDLSLENTLASCAVVAKGLLRAVKMLELS